MKLDPKAALILIDIQKGFDQKDYWGKRNNPKAEKNMALLLNAWRKTHRPIFHIKHNSLTPNSPLQPNQIGNEIKDELTPLKNEPLFAKTVNSAFIGTNLEKELRKNKISSVVIIGLTTDHCVSTTTRMAANLGFNTYIVSDATATFDRTFKGKHYSAQDMHNFALISLNNEFATVLTTQEILGYL